MELRDDGGQQQQESDVEMGTQGTDVQPGPPPSTSQVASDNDDDDDLAVPGKPRSKMVMDNRTPEDHASLDAMIFNELPSSNPAFLDIRLEGGLRLIAAQNGYDIDPIYTLEAYDWLRALLIDQWDKKSFTKIRRLGECPPGLFPVNSVP